MSTFMGAKMPVSECSMIVQTDSVVHNSNVISTYNRHLVSIYDDKSCTLSPNLIYFIVVTFHTFMLLFLAMHQFGCTC